MPLVLEHKGVANRMLAVDAGASVIVTFNTRDFVGVDRFGIRVFTPREYLHPIREIP